jgi:hypothetical protein
VQQADREVVIATRHKCHVHTTPYTYFQNILVGASHSEAYELADYESTRLFNTGRLVKYEETEFVREKLKVAQLVNK